MSELDRAQPLFAAAYEKSACALLAIQRVLNEQPATAATADFLADYAAMAALPAASFTRVWSDPAAYWWMRRAFDLLRDGGSLSDPLAGGGHAPLPEHLRHFKLFVLAAAHLAQTDVHLRQPLMIARPFALPGTAFYFAGTEALTLSGLRANRLLCVTADEMLEIPLGPESVHSAIGLGICPVISHPHATGPGLRLQPYCFNQPGLAEMEAVVRAGMDWQRQHQALIVSALARIETYQPGIHAAILQTLQVLALKPLSEGGYRNFSHSDLPGAPICGVIRNSWKMADTLIHEYHHNLLFLREDAQALLAGEPDPPENHYSPWRDDVRPVRGLLHAVYVYIPVCRFWLAVYADATAEADPAYVRSQIVRIGVQLQLGLHQLTQYARFTEAGQNVLHEMQAAVSELTAAIRATGLSAPTQTALICRADGRITGEAHPFSGQAMTVAEALIGHQQQHDPHGECNALLTRILAR